MKITNPDQDWFCYASYAEANLPKMESELFNYARKLILYNLVVEGDFNLVINELQLHQDTMAEEHPGWKRTNIRYTDLTEGGHCWLVIGECHLCLCKVLGKLTYDLQGR